MWYLTAMVKKKGNRNRTIALLCFFLIAFFADSGYCRKGDNASKKKEERSSDHHSKKKTGCAGTFFNERFSNKGFSYSYPQESSLKISTNCAKNGKASLQFDLFPHDYSGGSVCLLDKTYNLRPFIHNGAVQFWIKGGVGGENGQVALVDEAVSDNRKTVVRVDINWFGKIDTVWTFVSIPLKHFGEQGVYWDEAIEREVEAAFNWSGVAEFRIETRKDENASFSVWVDDIIIVKSIR